MFECQRWPEVSQILDRFLDQGSDDVEDFLDRACAGDRELSAEVRSFLDAGPHFASAFSRPAMAQAAPFLRLAESDEAPTFPSRRIGRFELVREVGRGGMGVVFEAWDPLLQRQLAIKLITGGSTPPDQKRLLAEARTASGLDHPNICTVYDCGEADDGMLYIAMALYRGETLKEKLEGGPLPIWVAKDLAIQIAKGLDWAHSAGIVHRDIKPANVIIVDIDQTRGAVVSGLAKILDFGIAQVSQGTDPSPLSPGTPGYMSPEQILGEPVTAKSDYWSLGVVLFEMITGQRPFEGSTCERILAATLCNEKRPLRSIREEVPWALESIVSKLLATSSTNRYRNATDLLSDLESLQFSAVDGGSQRKVRLRTWHPPEYPVRPYPLLLPYDHPELLGGRASELVELGELIARDTPILGLYAPSGAGKSSFLHAGLIPKVRSHDNPVAADRYPHEPGLAARLLRQLLEGVPHDEEVDPKSFCDHLGRIRNLTGKTVLCVIDQFEDVLDMEAPDRSMRRADIGRLIATTVAEKLPGQRPLCRWILAHRQDAHGELRGWLEDVLREARDADYEVAGLPFALDGPERFHVWRLPLLGERSLGSLRTDAPFRAFKAAIEAPLLISMSDGRPRYPLSFADDGAERLARAFARERLRQPGAPLTTELQVVLAYLEKTALSQRVEQESAQLEITVDKDLDQLISDALENHLRSVLQDSFPSTPAGQNRRGRSLALLALSELAHSERRVAEGLSANRLAEALGDDGLRILERLAAADARLLVRCGVADETREQRFALAHDRLAPVVLKAIEKEGTPFQADSSLLRLRKVITLNTDLYREGEARQATSLSRSDFNKIKRNESALLWDDESRAWWSECQERRNRRQNRILAWSATSLIILTLLTFLFWGQIKRTNQIHDLLTKTSTGHGAMSLASAARLLDLGVEPSRIAARLREREPADIKAVLESRPEDVPLVDWQRWRLKAIWLLSQTTSSRSDSELELVGAMAWALDEVAFRTPALEKEAAELRAALLKPFNPPAPPPETDSNWIFVGGGMARLPGTGSSSGPGTRPSIPMAPFRMLAHEVTVKEIRRLIPGHRGTEESLPAVLVNWYQAYAYAAWRGGRLPTEAEWEYAAQADCRFRFCDQSGKKVELGDVAWSRENSKGLRPGCLKARNPWGFCDMVGNAWEWVADWYQRDVIGQPSITVRGPIEGDVRVIRGGSSWNVADWANTVSRERNRPTVKDSYLGFRVVLPGEIQGPKNWQNEETLSVARVRSPERPASINHAVLGSWEYQIYGSTWRREYSRELKCTLRRENGSVAWIYDFRVLDHQSVEVFLEGKGVWRVQRILEDGRLDIGEGMIAEKVLDVP